MAMPPGTRRRPPPPPPPPPPLLLLLLLRASGCVRCLRSRLPSPLSQVPSCGMDTFSCHSTVHGRMAQ